jgi:hypothetical protein
MSQSKKDKEAEFRKDEAKLLSAIRRAEVEIRQTELKVYEMKCNKIDLENALFSMYFNQRHGWR